MDGKFAETKTRGSKESRKVTMHAFKGDEEADIFSLDDFKGATRVVCPVHKNGASDRIRNFRGGALLPGIHSWGTDSAGKVGLVRLQKLEESRKIAGVILTVSIHHGGVGPGGG